MLLTLAMASETSDDLLLEFPLFIVPLGEANIPLLRNLALGGI